jgi:hypothetical protein
MSLPDKPTCAVPGCLRTTTAKGLCQAHYQRHQKTGDVQADVPVRRKSGTAVLEEARRKREAGPVGVGLREPGPDLRDGIERLYEPGWPRYPEGIYLQPEGRRWYVWVADDPWSEPKLSQPFVTLKAARRYLNERLGKRTLIDGDKPLRKLLPRHSEEVRNLPPGAYLDLDRQVYVAVLGEPGSLKGRMAVVVETSEVARMLASLGAVGARALSDRLYERDREAARAALAEMAAFDDELTRLIEVAHDYAVSRSQGMTGEEWSARHDAEMAEAEARRNA